MVVATNMPSPGYSASSFQTLEDYKSRFPASYLAFCPCKTPFPFGKMLYLQLPQKYLINNFQNMALSIRSSADGSRVNSTPTNNTSGGTRLTRIIQAIQIRVNARIREFQKNLPMKLLFLLAGFYCATAFATVIGQTGDWDILSAALAVVIVEGIGALTYKASLPFVDNVRIVITMCNYWKAGLSLGLFLDSFKY